MFENLTTGFELYFQGSVLLAYLSAYVGGVLVASPPACTHSFPSPYLLSGRGKRDRAAAVSSLSVVYVLGTSLTYTILGSIAGLTGGFFGDPDKPVDKPVYRQCLHPYGTGHALRLLYLPSADLQQSSFQCSKKGLFGALLLGIASGLIMSPCSAPVLAVLLSYVATKQNVLFGMSLLFVFAFGMGTSSLSWAPSPAF